MAIDINTVLQTIKKPFGFVVRIASESGDEPSFEKADVILRAKGMTKRTNPKALPLTAQPLEFKRLVGFVGTIYRLEMEFEYPITPSELTNELCHLLNMDRAFVVVRTAENPFEQIEDEYLDYKDEDYIPMLVRDEIENKVDANDYYGDEYNKNLVKTLQSKEAKKHQSGFKELDKKMYKGM